MNLIFKKIMIKNLNIVKKNSKFNKERHENLCQSKIILNQKIENYINKENNDNHQEKNIEFKNDYEEENINNIFIGFKRNSNCDLNLSEKENPKEKSLSKDNEINNDNILNEDNDFKSNDINKRLKEERIDQFNITSNIYINEHNISDIIKNNFYYILKENDYISLANFFMLKNLVIGH